MNDERCRIVPGDMVIYALRILGAPRQIGIVVGSRSDDEILVMWVSSVGNITFCATMDCALAKM